MFRSKHERAVPALIAIALDELAKIRIALNSLANKPNVLNYAPRSTPADNDLRPCYGNGRKALFHRWVNTARPQLPKGQELSENARFFQFRTTHGLVEYEDGTMDQVWPRDIKFADHGRFHDYAWDPAEEE